MKINIKNILNNVIKNKKILFSILAVLLLIFIIIWFFIFRGEKKSTSEGPDHNISVNGKVLPAPEFLSDEEKESLGVPIETRAQGFRDSNGNRIYKIIKSDSDIVLDPAAVGPISPRQK